MCAYLSYKDELYILNDTYCKNDTYKDSPPAVSTVDSFTSIRQSRLYTGLMRQDTGHWSESTGLYTSLHIQEQRVPLC